VTFSLAAVWCSAGLSMPPFSAKRRLEAGRSGPMELDNGGWCFSIQ